MNKSEHKREIQHDIEYTSCQSEKAFDEISTSSTREQDVSMARGSPTQDIC